MGSAAISACEKGKQWEWALRLLGAMPSMKVAPNKISYTAAIIACEKGKQCEWALRLLGAMPSMKVAPNEITYNCILDALRHHSVASAPYLFFEEALAHGMFPCLRSHMKGDSIDLHTCSEGSATQAVKWWLANVASLHDASK